MIEALLQEVRDETNRYALLKMVPTEAMPELLSELEVIGWNLKSVIPVGTDQVQLLLRRNA